MQCASSSLIAALVAVAVAVAPGVASAFSCGVSLDKFNRATARTSALTWVEQANAIGVTGNAATNAAANPACDVQPTQRQRGMPDVSTRRHGDAVRRSCSATAISTTASSSRCRTTPAPTARSTRAFFYAGNGSRNAALSARSAALTPRSPPAGISVWAQGHAGTARRRHGLRHSRAELQCDRDRPRARARRRGRRYDARSAEQLRAPAPRADDVTKHRVKTTSATRRRPSRVGVSGSHCISQLDGSELRDCGSTDVELSSLSTDATCRVDRGRNARDRPHRHVRRYRAGTDLSRYRRRSRL